MLKFSNLIVLLLLTITLQNVVKCAESKNILFFNGFSSHSHLVAMEPLAHKLADLGHNLTILSPMQSENKHPKIKYFCPEAVLAAQQDSNSMGAVLILAKMENKHNNLFLHSSILWDRARMVCSQFWTDVEFQLWVKTAEFDLLVIDAFSRECAFPLAHIFKSKTIIFSPSAPIYGDVDTFGFGTESSWSFSFETENWIPEVIVYEWSSIKWYLWRLWIYLPSYDKLIGEEYRKMMKDGENSKELMELPTIAELERKTDLYFLNTHFSSDFGRAFPPFVVPIGGMHCRESNGIKNKEIRDFVEDPNSDGFIYMSFGSFFQISALPPHVIQIFLDMISNFPRIKFLWKWEGKFPDQNLIPKNVYFSKWFPQQDVLGHAKCRGFILQGGLMSFQQAVFHGVPLIIIPAAGDQDHNAKLAKSLGIAQYLQFAELTLDIFTSAVKDLLGNEKYRIKAKELSVLSRDRPLSALDTAVYWVEYLLRHDNVDHLKSPGMNQFWWERRLLHVYGGLFTILFLFLWISLKMACHIFKSLFPQNGIGNGRVLSKNSTSRKKHN